MIRQQATAGVTLLGHDSRALYASAQLLGPELDYAGAGDKRGCGPTMTRAGIRGKAGSRLGFADSWKASQATDHDLGRDLVARAWQARRDRQLRSIG
jgi:hypothetical protein